MKNGYIPLYRKYRPQILEDVVGQTHIKQALTNAITSGKIAHAYLFTGPRGTGKTSTARILAKSLNCINGPTVTPCNECESCQSIINTIPIDVIEIDAASNRSVEQAHNILEKVQYAPVNGKYKIYIIDEVHMLTSQAFNALLKTLEEPPENVVFILATTESHKVLDTIKSRCQRFDFKRITTNDITNHLKKIAEKEGIKITDGAISLIAKNSAGGMRDSLALLDQVSALGVSKEIDSNDINNLLGRLSFEVSFELTKHIVNSDGTEALKVLEKIYHDGNEPIQILNNLIHTFKNLLLVKSCEKKIAQELTELTESQIDELSELAKIIEKHQIISLIDKTAEYIKEIKLTTNQQLWMEVSLIDLANLTENTKLMDLQKRIERLESGNVSIQPVKAIPPKITTIKKEPKPEPIQEQQIQENFVQESAPSDTIFYQTLEVDEEIERKPEVKEEQPTVPTPTTNDIKSLWLSILSNIPSQGDRALLMMANPIQIDKNGIVLAFNNSSFVDKTNNPQKKQVIIESAKQILGVENISVQIRLGMPSDKKIEKITKTEITQNQPKKQLFREHDEISDEELQSMPEKKQEKDTNDKNYELTDQENMIKDLFDGKIID